MLVRDVCCTEVRSLVDVINLRFRLTERDLVQELQVIVYPWLKGQTYLSIGKASVFMGNLQNAMTSHE